MPKSIDLATLGLPPLPSHSSETISALLWAREIVQKHLATTYKINDPKGIEELKPINIGGVDQWLHIRGRNHNNPILLYLHGGPGCSMIGARDSALLSWEDYFTVVRWDQRQTGKSYYPAKDETDPLTINQFLSDTEEVIQYLQCQFNQKKIILLGHSWGSILGMHMVKRHPEWIHAYIGIGQVVNWMANEEVLFKRLYNHAEEQQDMELLSKLKTIAPYPDPDKPAISFVKNTDFLRMSLQQISGEVGTHHYSRPHSEYIQSLAFERLISPHLTLTDVSHSLLGDDVALMRPPYSFTEEFMAVDLPKQLGSSFEVPIFFFSGRHDYQTPVTLSDEWFSQIEAPHKELIHFEESAHIVVSEEPGKVLVNLVNKVLPFCQNQAQDSQTQDGIAKEVDIENA